MKREPLLTEDYFSEVIPYFERRKGRESERMEGAATAAGKLDHARRVYDSCLNLAYNAYSSGSPVSGLPSLTIDAVEGFIRYQQLAVEAGSVRMMEAYFDMYVEGLNLLALLILLSPDASLLKRFVAALDVTGHDALLDALIATQLPDRQKTGELLWPKPFGEVYALFTTDDDRAPHMAKYLDGWYKKMKPASWHNAHKFPDGSAFFGYWSFESAAVTRVLDIDDSSYRNKTFYPKDLVSYQPLKHLF